MLLQLFYLASYAFDGFANACEALVGRAAGAGQLASVPAITRLCWCCALGVGAVFALLYATLGTVLLAAMSDQQAVVAVATVYLPWMVLVPLLQAGATVYDGLLVGTLRLTVLRDAAVLASVGFALLAVVLVPLFGNHGLWASFAAHFAFRQLGAVWLNRRREQLAHVAAA